MTTIEIKAIDTLFFRDGRPFEMGEDNWAEGIFPPPLSVFIGALRSAYFTHYPEKIGLLNTNDDPTQKLIITDFYMKKGDRIYQAAPLDYVRKKNEDDKRLYPLMLVSLINKISNFPLPNMPFYDEPVEGVTSHFISRNSFQERYKLDGTENIKGYELKEFIQTEAKIGVGLDKYSRSAQEGRLFRVGLNRLSQKFDNDKRVFEDVFFIIKYNLDFVPTILKLGAENKAVIAKPSFLPKQNSFDELMRHSKYFKIVLITAAYFNKGWCPNTNTLFPNIEVELMTAFVGKTKAIGGWDIKNRTPKPMVRCVPAGSVFYYRIKSNHTLKDILEKISKKNYISDDNKLMGLFDIAFLNYDKILIE